MDAKTETALRGSIEHWERNAKAQTWKQASVRSDDCALCQVFNTSDRSFCKGCPVAKKTGRTMCGGTPYPDAVYARISRDMPAFREAAQREVDFLKSLLPAGAN